MLSITGGIRLLVLCSDVETAISVDFESNFDESLALLVTSHPTELKVSNFDAVFRQDLAGSQFIALKDLDREACLVVGRVRVYFGTRGWDGCVLGYQHADITILHFKAKADWCHINHDDFFDTSLLSITS